MKIHKKKIRMTRSEILFTYLIKSVDKIFDNNNNSNDNILFFFSFAYVIAD